MITLDSFIKKFKSNLIFVCEKALCLLVEALCVVKCQFAYSCYCNVMKKAGAVCCLCCAGGWMKSFLMHLGWSPKNFLITTILTMWLTTRFRKDNKPRFSYLSPWVPICFLVNVIVSTFKMTIEWSLNLSCLAFGMFKRYSLSICYMCQKHCRCACYPVCGSFCDAILFDKFLQLCWCQWSWEGCLWICRFSI